MPHVTVDSLGWMVKSPVLMSSLHRAQTYATQQQHRQLTLDHLLLALTEDSDALVVLHASDVDIVKLRSAISDLVGRNDDRAIVPDLAGPSAASELITIFEYASAAADQSGRGVIDGAIVLAALIGEGNSSAARILETHGLTFEHAIASLQNMTYAQPKAPVAEAPPDLNAPLQVESKPALSANRFDQDTAPPNPVTGPAIWESPKVAPPQAPPQAAPAAAQPPNISSNSSFLRAPPQAAPPAAQPPFSHLPQSFGSAGSAGAPPTQSRPLPATPRQGLSGKTGSAGPAPQTPRWGINENTGSAGLAPQTARRIGASERAPIHRTRMPGPVSPAEDGMIAPWPDPETAAPPPLLPGQLPPLVQPHPSQQVRRRYIDAGGMRGGEAPPQVNAADARGTRPRTSPRTSAQAQPDATPNAVVEEGQLIENIPRKMRVGIPEQVEVRIARNSVNVPTDNMQGTGAPQTHDLYVTKAMTVRLRAPEGGVRIETSSPETQWIDNALGLIHDDFASWRWTVTPELRGTTKLQLVVSARTVGADGVAAETALPDQIFDVVVRMNYARSAKRLGGWAVAAAAGGVITAFGADAYSKILALVKLV